MTRVFLMKWYHFSVEYFEDLRNVNHCEFVVMKKSPDSGRYILQNQLRTWSELRRERQKRGSFSIGTGETGGMIPMWRKWGGCPDGCNHAEHNQRSSSAETARPMLKRVPVRKNTADLFKDDDELFARTSPRVVSGSPLVRGQPTQRVGRAHSGDEDTILDQDPEKYSSSREMPSKVGPWNDSAEKSRNEPSEAAPDAVESIAFAKVNLSRNPLHRPTLLALGGRDGGGSESGAGTPDDDEDDDEDGKGNGDDDMDPLTMLKTRTRKKPSWVENPTGGVLPQSLARALRGEFSEEGQGRAMADALGDPSDAEMEETDDEQRADKVREEEDMEKIVEEERRDRSLRGSVY